MYNCVDQWGGVQLIIVTQVTTSNILHDMNVPLCMHNINGYTVFSELNDLRNKH